MNGPALRWGVALLALLLGACAPPLTPEPTALLPRPTFTPTAVPATPTPTPQPTATPTPTPVPPPDPGPIAEAAKRGEARVRAAAGDADVVCLRQQDTDGDGVPEWLALTHQPGAAPSRLSAFVLDGEQFHPLPAALPEPGDPNYGLGQYVTCELEVRDVNADGRPEIAIFGHAEENQTLLHLYVWERETYRLLGAFSGTAGIFFEEVGGDLADRIIEGHRDQAAPSLAWHVIFTWDGQTYGWTSDRWAWYYLDRPHAYPTHRPEYAVISFYLALDDRDTPGAYALMSGGAQAGRPYDAWVDGFATTLRVEAGTVSRIPDVGDENNARVSALVTAWDNDAGRIIGRLWEVEWATVNTAEGWRLAEGTTQLLDTWEAPYWR